jgi:hypothetical protein
MPMSPRLLRPVAAGGFNPTRLAGLLLWLDASDASTVTLDTGVSEWRDKSGSGKKMTQDTGGNQPAYLTNGIGGKPALEFTATSSHFMRGAFSHTLSTMTCLVVAVMDSSCPSGGRFLSTSVSGSANDFGGNGHIAPTNRDLSQNAVCSQHDGGRRASRNITLGTPFIHLTSRDGTRLSSRINNGAEATYTPVTYFASAFANMMLSTQTSSGAAAGFMTGRISEIVFYDREVTADERSKLHQYLGKKYGITVS